MCLVRNAPFADSKQATDYRAWYINGWMAVYTNLHEERAEGGVLVGIGVRPDLCARGIGTQILRDACALALRGSTPFLTVRTWNMRAIRCYEKAGVRRTEGAQNSAGCAWSAEKNK